MSSLRCAKVKPDNEVDKLLIDYFTHESVKEWIELGESKTLMPISYKSLLDSVENYDVEDDDIYVISFPRSGTTWTQELVWLVDNNCDFEGAKQFINNRYLFLEGSSYLQDVFGKKCTDPKIWTDLDLEINKDAPKRYIKTHLPWELLPKKVKDRSVKAKIIYVMRNPKDACVSFYHSGMTCGSCYSDLNDYSKLFMAGRIYYAPYWNHVFGFWNRRNEETILVLRYEDMVKNIKSTIQQVATFLKKPLTENQIDQLSEHLDFKNLRHNNSVNNEDSFHKLNLIYKNERAELYKAKMGIKLSKFMRNGKAGGYKNEMGEETAKRFDKWIVDNTDGTDLKFTD